MSDGPAIKKVKYNNDFLQYFHDISTHVQQASRYIRALQRHLGHCTSALFPSTASGICFQILPLSSIATSYHLFVTFISGETTEDQFKHVISEVKELKNSILSIVQHFEEQPKSKPDYYTANVSNHTPAAFTPHSSFDLLFLFISLI